MIAKLRFFAQVIVGAICVTMATGPAPGAQGLADGEQQRRSALLICIQDYAEADDANVASDKVAVFQSLESPCNDVDRIALKLQQIGWKSEEIRILDPNPSFEAISGAVSAFLASMNDSSHETAPLGLIYIAAHAITVDHTPYILMPNATIDLSAARTRYARNPKNPQLFGTAALNLDHAYFQQVGEFCFCEIILVLDACREPAFGALELLRNGINGAKIELPTFYNDRPDGLGVLFATKTGGVVYDQPTTVIVESLSRTMERNTQVRDVFEDAVDRGREIAEQWGQSERPEFLYKANPQNRRMLFADALVSDTQEIVRNGSPQPIGEYRAPLSQRSGMHPLLWNTRFTPAEVASQGSGAAHDAPVEQNAPAVVYDRQTPNLAPIATLNLDVFWCEGDGAAARKRSAEAFAENARTLAVDNALEEGVALGRLRTRSLSVELNAGTGYRINSNEMRPEQDQAEEMAWARRLALQSARPGMKIVPLKKFRSPGYFSAFFCSGTQLKAVQEHPTIWFHVARDDQRPLASDLLRELARANEDFDVRQGVEVVPISPSKSQVRYFSLSDKAPAEKAAKYLSSTLGAQPEAVFVKTSDGTKVDEGHLEIWIGASHGGISVSASCSTNATGPDGARHVCSDSQTVKAAHGFKFLSPPKGGRTTGTGSVSECRTSWNNETNPTIFTVWAHARSPVGSSSGRGWVTCEYVVEQIQW